MSWSHYNPVRVIAGAGSAAQLGQHLPAGLQGPLLLLTSAGMQRRGMAQRIMQAAPGHAWTVANIAPNPDLDAVDALADSLRGQGFSAIVALGGGSAIDAAKALSLLLSLDGERQLDRCLRQQQAPDYRRALPVICLPTTSGTGAEVTPFATIWDGATLQKHSLADPALYPRVAILDPELTLALPPDETLYSALDACSHALETLWNRHATPVSCALALQSLEQMSTSLPQVRVAPENVTARAQLQAASNLAGMAISQSRTALAHAISYPLTARFGVPHGLACSFTLAAMIDWVEREQAWRIAVEAPLRGALQTQLSSYRLGEQLLDYCSKEQLLGCLSEMFNPQRAANFVLPATTEQVLQLLQASLPPSD